MVLALSLLAVFIINSPDPVTGLAIALPITLIFNIVAFFLSPWLMDLTQNWLYNTRWVSLAEIEDKSPETAKVIQKFCQQKKINQPRLGIIDDQNPTAFTYGSFPNSDRDRYCIAISVIPFLLAPRLMETVEVLVFCFFSLVAHEWFFKNYMKNISTQEA